MGKGKGIGRLACISVCSISSWMCSVLCLHSIAAFLDVVQQSVITQPES